MKIAVEGQMGYTGQDVEKVLREAWADHPLRHETVDSQLEDVSLTLAAADNTIAQWSEYPTVRILVDCGDPEVAERLRTTLYHELTHIIDRHNPRFMGDRSPQDLSGEMDELFATDQFLAHTVVAYWNMYIDGRLSRYAKNPYTLDERVAEFFGTRPLSDARPGEMEALRGIWPAEELSFDDVLCLAREFPKPKTQVEWIRQYYGRNAG